jgi:hypothetical protein
MSYRFRPVKYARDAYRWFLDRAEYVVVAADAVPVVNYFLLMETGDFLLLEDGSKIILE